MSKLPVPFSNPTTYAGHSGVDYPGHAGEPILASGPGVVVSRGRNDRGGFFIWVQYDGVSKPVGYHHMNSHDGCPALGARVTLAQRLGYVGWTGHVVPAGRAGAHLHSEVSGHATTDGYWKFFDRDRVVGHEQAAGGGVTPTTPTPTTPTPTTPTESEEDEMTATFINIQGKTGSHRGGCYAIMRSNSGVLFARFVSEQTLPSAPTVPATEYEAWADTMPIN